MAGKSLGERLAARPVICAEGYLFELERRGYRQVGARYLGLCCGAMPQHIRAVAEALGRTPPASRYSADMSKHAFFGTDKSLKAKNRKFVREL